MSQIFARALENSPSLIFIDEMDGLLPRSSGHVGQHDIQVTEQFMIEISNLQAEQNVFLVGTTNHPERIDARVLRGGRFSEKIEIGLPSRASRERLLRKYLDNVVLGSDAAIPVLAERLHDLSPADLEAISNAARRFAFNRAPDGSELPPLIWADFEKAVQRVRGTALNL
ncbi:MAG TPA: ATP-binding protein [Terriglobia bacterium]|nr:ATP-binding protein [Terriglobia bacterium]